MFIKQQEIQFRGIYFLILFSLIFFCNAFSQIGSDTIYLKKGNKVIGSIYQLYGNNVVKIKTQKGKVYSFSETSVSRLGFGYKKEMENKITLSKGDTIYGVILERKYDSNLRIKTSDNKIVKLFDSEIQNVEQRHSTPSNKYLIHLKDQNIFWGTLENQKKYNLMIVLNVWTNQLIRIEAKDILKIDTITTNLNSLQKIVQLNNGMSMVGNLNNISKDYYFLQTKKYGDFLIKRNEISQIKDSIESKKQIEIIQKADTSKNHKVSFGNKLHLMYSYINNSIKLFNLSAVASFGFVNSNIFYCMPQLGVNAQFIRYKKINLSSEMRLGLSTNLNSINSSINISPIILEYNAQKNLYLEVLPDIHMRFYKEGSKTTLGLLVGGNYYFNPKYALKLRLGYSGGVYLGISGNYILNDYLNL